eukprot:8609221-Prorocentrum_lima.AAC.1
MLNALRECFTGSLRVCCGLPMYQSALFNQGQSVRRKLKESSSLTLGGYVLFPKLLNPVRQ